MRLSEQCEELGLSLQKVELARSVEGWIVDGRAFKRPEPAVAELMRAEGWTCATCEGGPMLLLMKAASLELLMSMNKLGPEDSLTRFFEAQVTIHKDRLQDIRSAIESADTRSVVGNFERIYAAGVDQVYPGVSAELIEGLHTALYLKLPSIFDRFASDAYCYRAGWPDITATRDGEVKFREVKTTDKLHTSQIETFREVIKPSGLDLDLIQVVKHRNRA